MHPWPFLPCSRNTGPPPRRSSRSPESDAWTVRRSVSARCMSVESPGR
ncbi:hypothetical protein STIAU_7764 [Stigmatella aurantiaca DW4/3-1]|uniref:Uncharacterized protein n=1 Tax=Stigmatella aurantiaca (strain DW4/3-1) TaxID=378806 RepID=Q098N1_STIAD|nr:hypothetical protein STIAU_7764 [Stigmatella aurantiaca DW4/3-1]